MTIRNFNRSWLTNHWPALAIIALLVAGWFIYRPALSGTFLLDDHSNLAGLHSVSDAGSALHFVLTGDSGPLGRPLALASFLPQASAWEVDATPFIHVNILIHLLNGLLVFLLSRQLAHIVLHDRKDVPTLALATTAVWLFMPLLASSSLLIVQRMTTLSATFVLSGLNAYLLARNCLSGRPGMALVGISFAVVAFTLLAMLTKENGVLLPAFILVVEITLLRPPRQVSVLRWNAWCGVFLATPLLLLVAFLFAQVPYSDELVARREFTAAERLFSEARILWEYLFSAFFASSAKLGPFHEARTATTLFSDTWTLAAVIAWIVTVGAAVRWRRRYPVAALAVFWFLIGHLLESTTIPLELYFEHRNYLPIIGPVFALCYLVFRIPARFRGISRIALAVYAIMNAAILFGVTSMWGNPLLAATYWHNKEPASVRAATTRASQQLSSTGAETAITTLRNFAKIYPQHAYIRIPELNLACAMAPRKDHSGLVEYLGSSLPSVTFSLTVGEMLDELLSRSVTSECRSVQPSTVATLTDAVMENPRYSGSVHYNQFHFMLKARIARVSGNTDETLEYLGRAIEVLPSDDLNMMTVTTLVEAGRFDEARSFIEKARKRLPRQPLRRYNSKRYLDVLLTYVNEAGKLASKNTSPSTGE
jgi:tetratricopeptide (TPR) repeat protein